MAVVAFYWFLSLISDVFPPFPLSVWDAQKTERHECSLMKTCKSSHAHHSPSHWTHIAPGLIRKATWDSTTRPTQTLRFCCKSHWVLLPLHPPTPVRGIVKWDSEQRQRSCNGEVRQSLEQLPVTCEGEWLCNGPLEQHCRPVSVLFNYVREQTRAARTGFWTRVSQSQQVFPHHVDFLPLYKWLSTCSTSRWPGRTRTSADRLLLHASSNMHFQAKKGHGRGRLHPQPSCCLWHR